MDMPIRLYFFCVPFFFNAKGENAGGNVIYLANNEKVAPIILSVVSNPRWPAKAAMRSRVETSVEGEEDKINTAY